MQRPSATSMQYCVPLVIVNHCDVDGGMGCGGGGEGIGGGGGNGSGAEGGAVVAAHTVKARRTTEPSACHLIVAPVSI